MKKLEFVKPFGHTGGTTIHAIRDDKAAYCGWVYLSGETMNGRPIPRGFTVEGPLTCNRCKWALQTEIVEHVRRLPVQETPALYDHIFGGST